MRRKSPAGQKPKTPTWVWAVAVIVPLALALFGFLVWLRAEQKAELRRLQDESWRRHQKWKAEIEAMKESEGR